MRLVHTFATDGGIDVIAKVLHAGAAYKTRDNATSADNVEHGNLFGDTQRVIVQRQSIAHYADFRTLHALGEYGGHEIRRRHGTIGILMMLVDNDTVPA